MTDIERDTVVAVAHLCLVGTGVCWLGWFILVLFLLREAMKEKGGERGVKI